MAHMWTRYHRGHPLPAEALPRFGTRTAPNPTAAHGSHPPPGLFYKEWTLITPSPEVREARMGFTSGDTIAQGLTKK